METKPENPLREIFLEAAELDDPRARAAYLDAACGNDTSLRQRVEALLAAEAGAGPPPAAAEPAISDVSPGSRIGSYRLQQQIGEGGCGVVFMAEQEQPVRRRVALKVIKLGMDTKQVVARFDAERQALAMMDHPNIARVFDAGATESGRPYFVMELVRGIRITEYCDQQRFPVRRRLELFIQVCQAVQHAHQKGVIHRDLKPSNILVTEVDGKPVPKIIDFGIAKAVSGRLTDQTLFTAFEQLIGTPAYMSPEQAALNAADIDTRSDIYSLGVLLYELLTGETPFDTKALLASGLDELRRTIREVDPIRPSTRLTQLAVARNSIANRKSQIENDLDWIVMKCLEKERGRRYETANSLAMDVRRHLDNEPIIARPPSRLYEFQKTVRRHWVGFGATAVIIAALGAALWISTWQAGHARRSADLARGHAYAADMNLVQRLIQDNRLGEAQEILSRHRPGSGEKDWRGWEWRYLWQQCRRDRFVAVTQSTNRIGSLSVSSKGRWLAVGEHERGGLSIWDLQTRTSTARLSAGDGKVHVAFSSSEPLLAYSAVEGPSTNRQSSIRLWNPASHQSIGELPLGAECVGLAFSRDGQTLVTSTGDPDHQITLWRLSELKAVAAYPARQTGAYEAISFAVAGDLSVAAYGSPTIHLLDLQTGEVRWRSDVPVQFVMALAFSADGKMLASSAGWVESAIRLWDVGSGNEIGRLEGHGGWVGGMAFLPDGESLVSASADGTIRVWDLTQITNGASSRVLGIHQEEVWRFAFVPGSTKLVSGDRGGGVRLWDSGDLPDQKVAVTLPVRSVWGWRFAPDGRSILTLSRDQIVRWTGDDFQQGEPLMNVALGSTLRGTLFSRDGRFLAIASADGRVQVWDISRRLPVSSFTFRGTPFPVAFRSNNQRLVVADLTGEFFHEWDLGTEREIRSWRSGGAISQVSGAFAFSPDERYCLCITHDGTTFLYDLVKDRETSPTLNVIHPQEALFSSDGKVLAVLAHEIGVIKLWETGSFRELGAFRKGGFAFCMSPDGTRLAAGGATGGVTLFDVAIRRPLFALDAHPNITSCEFSQDGRLLGAVGLGYLHVWRAPTWEEIGQAELAGKTLGSPSP